MNLKRLRWIILLYALCDLLVGYGGFIPILEAQGGTTQLLSSGGVGLSCNAVTAATSSNPGTSAGCTAFALVTSGGSLPSVITWNVATTGSPTIVVNLMESLDGVTWNQADTTTSTGTRTVSNVAYKYVGCVPATLSGGTVSCTISVSTTGGGGSGSCVTTVSSLSTQCGTVKGTLATVTDGNSATDCTTGSGSTVVACSYSGTVWSSVGGGGAGNVTGSGITTGVKGQRIIANGTANTIIPTSAGIDVTPYCAGNTTSSDYGICINAATTANLGTTIDLRGLPSKVYINSPMVTPQGYILSAAGTASGGNTVYTGVFPAAANALANGPGGNPYTITISGFSTGANNGTFTISASTATTITVNNASGAAETHAALGSLSAAQMFSGTILLGNTVFFINSGTGLQTFGGSINIKGNGKTQQLTGPYGAGTGSDFELCSSTDTQSADFITYCASTAYTATLTNDGNNYPAIVTQNGYLPSAGAVGSSGSTLLSSRLSGVSVGCGMIANATGFANYSAQEGSRMDDFYWHDCSAAGDIGLDLGGGTGGAQNSWYTDCQGTTLSGKTNAASAVGIRIWAGTGNGLIGGIQKCSVVNNSAVGTKPNYDVEIVGGSSTAGQTLLSINHYESAHVAAVAFGVATVKGVDQGGAVNGVTVIQDNCGPGFDSGAGTGCFRFFSNANLTGAAATNIQLIGILATNATPTNVIADDNNTVIPIATKYVAFYETSSTSTVLEDSSGNNVSNFAGGIKAAGGISTGAAIPAANTITGLSFIDDVNGNKSIGLTATGSAVDYVAVTNAATANPATVTLTASGTDTNINLNLVSKGTGTVQCNGASCGGGSPTFPVLAKTSSYQTLSADWSACKTITMTSATATSVTALATAPASGQCIYVKNLGSAVTWLVGSGSNTIDGLAVDVPIYPYQGALVVSDGTNYNLPSGIGNLAGALYTTVRRTGSCSASQAATATCQGTSVTDSGNVGTNNLSSTDPNLYVQYTSGAVAGNAAGHTGNNNNNGDWRTGQNLRADWAGIRYSNFNATPTTSAQRNVLGLASTTAQATLTGSDTPAITGAWFRYSACSSGCANDTDFIGEACKAGVCGTCDTGVAVDANRHRFTIQFEDITPQIIYIVDGSHSCVISTAADLPASGTNLYEVFVVSTQGSGAAARNGFYSRGDFSSDF